MNLWSELDNLRVPDEAAGRGRRSGEQSLLADIRGWLLRDYVAPYCATLAASRIYRRCYWLDAWGGDTRPVASLSVSTDSSTHNGSKPANGRKKDKKDVTAPLPAMLLPVATLAETLAQAERPLTLQGLALAAGSSRRVTKQKDRSTAQPSLTIPKESGLVDASWLEAAPGLLKEVESSPAIFLLNSFGAIVFSHDDFVPLYQRVAAPTELCLLILHKQAETRLLSTARTTEGAAALTTLLRTDRWKNELPSPATKPTTELSPFLDGIIELLVAAIRRHFVTVQRIAFPVRSRPPLIEDAPCTLLFASRSKESVLCMNDAVCQRQRLVARESYAGLLNEAWFARLQEERADSEQDMLRELIARQDRAQRSRRWPELRQHLILSHFGRFPVSEYDAILAKLNGE